MTDLDLIFYRSAINVSSLAAFKLKYRSFRYGD